MQLGQLIRGKPILWPIERFSCLVVFVIAMIDLGSLFMRDIGFDWLSYSLIVAIGGSVIFVGILYRVSGRSERISIALVATGILVLFTMVLSIFNYLLLPLHREPFDLYLAQIDTWLGYSWPGIVEFAGQHSYFNELTRYAYVSTLPQIALLVIILGFQGKQKELHEYILFIIASGLVTIGFWAVFPTFGTSVLYDISGAIEQTARPLVGSAYGAELLRLGAEGPTYITPEDIEGLVAFPSFHTVLAILTLYAARTTSRLFAIVCVINLFVLPGILIHGGHHLIDVFGGISVAFATIYLAHPLVQGEEIPPDEACIGAKLKPAIIHCQDNRSEAKQ